MTLRTDYKDKMLGCWIGKSIGGTIGGPLEGNTNFLDLPYEYPKVNIDNDDLDLQLVWLHQLERWDRHLFGSARTPGHSV